MSTSPLSKFMGKSDALARLREHANYLSKLQRKVEACLPANSRPAIHVANLQEGELVLHVESPALAARLKLSQNGLINELQIAGEPVKTLKIKVRTQSFQGNDRYDTSEVRSIGTGGKEALRMLEENLDPDDPLASALRRMLDRSQ